MKSRNPLRLIVTVGCLWLLSTAQGLTQENVAKEDPYASQKVFYEEHWQEKIERILQYIQGVVVSVNVELSPEIAKQVITEKFNSPSMAISTHENISSMVYKPDSKTGTVAAGPHKFLEKGAIESTQEEVETKSVIAKTQTTTTNAGLIPTQVSVSIAVPRSFLDAVYSRRFGGHSNSVAKKGEEKTAQDLRVEVRNKIERTVNMLLPRGKLGEDEFNRVEVQFFDDLRPAKRDAATL